MVVDETFGEHDSRRFLEQNFTKSNEHGNTRPHADANSVPEHVPRLQYVAGAMRRRYPGQKIVLVVKDVPMDDICESSELFDLTIIFVDCDTNRGNPKAKAIDDHALQITELAAHLQQHNAEIDSLDDMVDKYSHKFDLVMYNYYVVDSGLVLKSFHIDPKTCNINPEMPHQFRDILCADYTVQ